MEEKTITEKLVKFEKYLRRQNIMIYTKKNIIFKLHEIFEKEMWNTKTGIKWRKKLDD